MRRGPASDVLGSVRYPSEESHATTYRSASAHRPQQNFAHAEGETKTQSIQNLNHGAFRDKPIIQRD